MITKQLLQLLLTTFLASICTSQQQQQSVFEFAPCLAYQAGSCQSCPLSFTIYQNQCIPNIQACKQYATQNSTVRCVKCDDEVAVADGLGGCKLTISQIEYQSKVRINSAASNYGDRRFLPISLQWARSLKHFQICDSFMRTNYRQHIGISNEPVRSVSTFNESHLIRFKIIYEGSGDGLMLCIIAIEKQNFNVQLMSFVAIGISKYDINNCQDFDVRGNCLRCVNQYHLQQGICYRNIQNCISFSKNICLMCRDYLLLIQNRCIGGCSDMGDTSQLRFYGDYRYLGQFGRVYKIDRSYLYGVN